MREIIIKRNKLKDDAMKLREVKFEEKIKPEHSLQLNKEQNKLWKKYEFYNNIIKAYNKSEVRK